MVIWSTTKAEFWEIVQRVYKLFCLRSSGWPNEIYCNNKSIISIAYNPIQQDQKKHIEIDRHFIKEKLKSGLICTFYASTHGELVDILIKGLSSSVFQSIASKIERKKW